MYALVQHVLHKSTKECEAGEGLEGIIVGEPLL